MKEKEMRKAIELIGFGGVYERIKTPEDKVLCEKISAEFRAKHKANDDKRLKRAGISFKS
jgi:hypothetical protein